MRVAGLPTACGLAPSILPPFAAFVRLPAGTTRRRYRLVGQLHGTFRAIAPPRSPPSLRSAAVSSRSVAADELLSLLADRRGGGVRGRALTLSWVDVRTRALEMLHGLRAAGIDAGGAIAFTGRLRPERFCAELGAIAGGYALREEPADVVVVDDAWAAEAIEGTALVVVIDGAATGRAIALDRLAARGIAWAASHQAVAQPVPVTGVVGLKPPITC